VPETVPQIPLKQIADPDKILLGKAFVQIVLRPEGRLRFFADPPAAGNGTDGVGGGKADKEKYQRRHRQKYRRQEDEPFEDVPDYIVHLSLAYYIVKRKKNEVYVKLNIRGPVNTLQRRLFYAYFSFERKPFISKLNGSPGCGLKSEAFPHSLIGIVHFSDALRTVGHSILNIASSEGNSKRFLATFRNWQLSDSMALVV
jgi:hypothetical protein